MMSSVVYS